MTTRRDITGIARDLRVDVDRIQLVVHELTQELGESAVIAEREYSLGNHELTEAAYTRLCDEITNSPSALLADVHTMAKFLQTAGWRRDAVSTVDVRSWRSSVTLTAGIVAAILSTVDLFANASVQLARWADGEKVHIRMQGAFDRRPYEVATTVEGDEAARICAAVDWADSQVVTYSVEELSELADKVSAAAEAVAE